MSGFVKNKKLLFDGAESDFYVFSSTLDTKDFGSVLFDNRKVQYLWGLGAKRGHGKKGTGKKGTDLFSAASNQDQ